MHTIINTLKSRKSKSIFGLFITMLFCCNYQSFAQTREKEPLQDIDIKILSSEIEKFDKPIRRGTGDRTIEYQEALVLKIKANKEQLDNLPPSIVPFLYIGTMEYRIFDTEKSADSLNQVLVFHIRDWLTIEDNVPVVLTINHGDPERNPKKYMRQNFPRFTKSQIVDKR